MSKAFPGAIGRPCALPRSSGEAVRPLGRTFDKAAALLAMLMLAAIAIAPWISADPTSGIAATEPGSVTKSAAPPPSPGRSAREILLAAYVGAPWYYRSDVHLERPDGTDLRLKQLGWDGDAFYFPIDGGFRSVEWWGSTGFMIDFLHNKAIARLGKGAHGRAITNGIIEDVATDGTLKGKPAPSPLKLTDLFERLEFTHGHNVLIFTPLLRGLSLTPRVRPYFGIGAGFAFPHVEVGFSGETLPRTSEYQIAGPAFQVLAGLEFRTGKASYFVEYKFQYAWISAALTAAQSVSWKQSPLAGIVPRWLLEPFVGLMELPGDLFRQAGRWWRGEPGKEGHLTTHLAAHQIVFGAGYWWQRPARIPTAP